MKKTGKPGAEKPTPAPETERRQAIMDALALIEGRITLITTDDMLLHFGQAAAYARALQIAADVMREKLGI